MASEDFKKIIGDGALVVDVRTPGEFAQGHMKGSLNIPLDQIGEAMSWLIKDVPIIFVCHSGNRSGQAVEIFKANGFEKVYNGGGWDSLGNIKAGSCPVE